MEDDIIEQPQPQRESTSEDYWNTVNPFAIQYNNPNVRFNPATDVRGTVDYEDTTYKALYDAADIETKRNMVGASNTSDAIKMAQRTEIFLESEKAIADDGLLTQIGMGILPAVASPTSLLPGGVVIKGAQMAKRVNRIYQYAGAGAVLGAGANVLDEALFDAQGMPTNYVGAAAIGAMFGGGLGALGGALAGPYKGHAARAMHPSNDTYTKDFNTDNTVTTSLDENGNIRIQEFAPMDKSLTDRVPYIGDWLRSDINTVFQSDSSVLRGYMARMASATVSLKDAAGNVMPVKFNGSDLKRKQRGLDNRRNKDVSLGFEEAKVQGFDGSRSDYNVAVYKTYMDELIRTKKDASAHANTKTAHINMDNVEKGDMARFREAYEAAKDEWYDLHPFEFKGSTGIVKGAEAYRTYFSKMLEDSQTLGMKGVSNVNAKRLYAPRVYDYKAIQSGKISDEDILSQIKEALAGDSRNNIKTAEDLDKHARGIAQQLKNTAFDLNNLTNSFMVKDLPFETHLKARKLYLDETKMYGLLRTDFEDIAGMYHYKMSGRQATQYAFGTDELTDIMQNIRKDHLDRGVMENSKEIQAFERTVKDLLGDLRINGLSDTPGWTFTRNLLTYNSTRMGGGFGGNQFIELAATVSMQGMSAIMNGRMRTSLRNSAKLLYTKGQDVDDFSEFLINSGFLSDALHTSRINRYADTEAGFNSGMIEKGLNGMNDALMKYNGMRYFMGVMEDFTGGAIVTKLKKGGVPETTLARWGLTKADADKLGKQLQDVTAGDKWDMTKMPEEDRDMLQMAIGRGIEEIVVQGDSMHLPAWMKVPSPYKSVLFQFMRFPLIAQEVLTRRGFKEDQANMVAGVLASSMAFLSLKYMREQASIAMGTVNEVDAKYDIFDDNDQLFRALGESLNYNAPLGFMSSVYNYGALATGNPELGRDWVGKNGAESLLGPTGGTVSDVMQIMAAAVSGDIGDERTLQKVKAMTPFMNLPLLNEGAKAFIDEYGD